MPKNSSDDQHYENTPIQIYGKFHLPKTENFQIKNSDIFYISVQNIDCGYSLEPPRRGCSNEYPQSMVYAVIRKIMYTPVNPSFTILKWGLRGSKLYRHVFVMRSQTLENRSDVGRVEVAWIRKQSCRDLV